MLGFLELAKGLGLSVLGFRLGFCGLGLRVLLSALGLGFWHLVMVLGLGLLDLT